MLPNLPGLTVPLAVVLLVFAVYAAVVARAGWSGTLHRDGRFGVRTPAATISDPAFRVANRVAAPVNAGAAVVGLLAAALVLFVPMPTALVVVIAVLAVLAVIALTVAGGLLGDRAARAVPVPARRPVSAGAGCGGCACGSGGCAGLSRN